MQKNWKQMLFLLGTIKETCK